MDMTQRGIVQTRAIIFRVPKSPPGYLEALTALEKQKKREQASYEFCESIRTFYSSHDNRRLGKNKRSALLDWLHDVMSDTHGIRLMGNGKYRRF